MAAGRLARYACHPGSDRRKVLAWYSPTLAARARSRGSRRCGRARRRYASEARGPWLRIALDEPDLDRARELSARFATAAVWCSLDSIVEQIWIVAFERGTRVRELHFADGAWSKIGEFAGEALAKWLGVKQLSAIPDGYDVLACVLGEDEPPIEKIDESHAAPAGWQRQALYFPSALIAELAGAAECHGAPMSRVLCAAWHLGKHALYEREPPNAPPPDFGPPPQPPPVGEPDPAERPVRGWSDRSDLYEVSCGSDLYEASEGGRGGSGPRESAAERPVRG